MSTPLNALYRRIRHKLQVTDEQWAALVVVILSSIAFLALGYVLQTFNTELAKAGGHTILSLELAFRGDLAAAIINSWDSGAKLDYAVYSLWLDFVFIGVYLAWMQNVVTLAWDPLRRLGTSPVFISALRVLPLLPALLDVLENILLLAMIDAQSGFPGWYAFVASLSAVFKFILVGLFFFIGALLARPSFKVLALVRFSLLMLLVGVILLFVPQWLEVLRVIIESRNSYQAIPTAAASLVAAFSTWYSARVMYMIDWSDYAPEMQRMKAVLPRFLGAAMPLLVMIGYWKAVKEAPVGPMLWQLLALVTFVLIVVFRRNLMTRPMMQQALIRSVFGEVKKTPVIDSKKYRRWRDLPARTKRVHWALLIVALLVLAVVTKSPLPAEYMGAAPILLLAVALIVPVGSFLVYLGTRHVLTAYKGTEWRIPVITSAFAAMVLFSLFNDNHYVRLCNGADSTTGRCPTEAANADMPASRSSDVDKGFNAYLEQWAKHRKTAGDKPVPTFIVSAEGGGIRAAYWTAHVLAVLQERLGEVQDGMSEPVDFSKHLLAISGVSGGSLGGATFAATVASLRPVENANAAAGSEKSDNSTRKSGISGYSDTAHEFLGRDFLAPTLSALMFPDLVQRLLPIPVFNDRAVALEQSWERGWSAACPSDLPPDERSQCTGWFKNAFDALWLSGDNEVSAKSAVPLLLLNSTVVATGKRLIMTPPHLSEHFDKIFNDAVDGRDVVGDRIGLSTAVHLSARFTYVSPAGTAYYTNEADNSRQWLRLVDGGYFENSGTVTAAELLAAVERYNKSGPKTKLEPFVIHISNEPIKPDSFKAPANGKPFLLMGEVLPPLNALLNVRPARGFQARDAIREQADRSGKGGRDYRFVHFRLCEGRTPLPLGWTLSEKVRCAMERQFPAVNGKEPGVCGGADEAPELEAPIKSATEYNDTNLIYIRRFLNSETNASGSGAEALPLSPEKLEEALIRVCGKPLKVAPHKLWPRE